MKVVQVLLLIIVQCCIGKSNGMSSNTSTRPKMVKIGAIFSFNSTIGRGAMVAIKAAEDDINSDPNILHGTQFVVEQQDSICNGFLGVAEALNFMEANVVAMIGPQSSSVARVISLVADELQVPLLSFATTDPTLSPLQYPFFIRTTRSDLFQMSAISDIIYYYQWQQLIAIYTDDDYGRNGISSLGDKLAERRCKISYKAPLPLGSSKEYITELLIRVQQMESRIIVLHANPDSGLAVLSLANQLGMVSTGYVWIATDWLATYVDASASTPPTIGSMQGVIGLRQHVPGSVRRSAFASRWTNLTQRSNLSDMGMSSYSLYAYDTVWIVARAIDAFLSGGGTVSFTADERLRDSVRGSLGFEAMKVFGGGKLLLDQILNTDTSGLTGRIRFDRDREIVLPAYDVLNVAGTGYRTVGYWTNHSGLSVELPESVYGLAPNRSGRNEQLRDVIWPGGSTTKPRGWVFPNNGKELKIGFPNRAGYKEFVTEVGGSEIAEGYCIDVFVAAVKLLPYAVPYTFVAFGDGKRNPSYMELVYAVASGDLDAAVGDIAIVTNRTRIVDFTQPFVESGLVILAAVKKQDSNAWAFMRPFTVSMWVVTGIFFFIVGAVVWILEHRSNKDFRGPPRRQLVTIFWFGFSTLFFAHKEQTVSTMGRFVLIIWLFVVLIIQSSYTANLTSILTVQQLSSSINGIDSLMQSNEPIGYQVGSYAANYMVEQLGISRSRLRVLYTPDDYARALELGPHNGGVMAIVDEGPYVDLFLSTQCKFAVIGSEFTRSGWGFAFPRDSPLAIDMSTAILTLSENGDLQRIHDKWLARKSDCNSDKMEVDADRLHLSCFQGLFLITGVACFIALVSHFLHMLWKFCKHIPQTTTDHVEPGRSKSISVLRSFVTFVGTKEEDPKAGP